MELKVKQLQLYYRVLLSALALALVVVVAAGEAISSVAAAATTKVQTLSGCISSCGDITIPYPFGIGYSSSKPDQPCYLQPRFKLLCIDSKLYFGNVPVQAISIEGQMDVMSLVSSKCYNTNGNKSSIPWLSTGSFTISRKENKFLTVGCNSYGYLNSLYSNRRYSTGCFTRCYGNNIPSITEDGTCSGIGCCQVDVPPMMRNITVEASGFPNSTDLLGTCTHSFVVKQGSYNFSTTDLEDFNHTRLPLVLDWTVGKLSCSASNSTGNNFACKNNTDCVDEDLDYGYRCTCKPGYEGNPYHPDGCTDIDECKISNHTCIDDNHCGNINGSHQCFCPKWQSGDGTKNGGCNKLTAVLIGAGAGIIILFLGIAILYLTYQKRKLMKLKEKFFLENGGFILQQKLNTRENSSQIVEIFTEDELMKATNNYDENLIIGKGGNGIVFKGFLCDKRIVAIKKSKIANKSQIEQFINEVVILSQINHRNVVKLLGCCLETKVPLLVYEFVSNGTLYDFIHSEGKVENVTWKTRLRIAAEAAGALSYLHSAASIPIIHSDVKGANILLDDTHTAKVSDFGASRLVPLDQTDIATIVQGTYGYLDPEYMQTRLLTEKSDVYSFGVVLVELLTGEKPVCFDRSEEKISLAKHFLSCLKEDRMFEVVQVEIMNEENKQEIKEVAILAARCLRLKGEKRPSMKEVAMELEGLRLMEKHPWTNREQDLEDTQYLLHEEVSTIYYECGDSSSLQNTGYDTSRDHVPLVVLHGGR